MEGGRFEVSPGRGEREQRPRQQQTLTSLDLPTFPFFAAMWALASPLRLSRASTSTSGQSFRAFLAATGRLTLAFPSLRRPSALRSFASSLPRSLEELPSQERITSSSQAGQETELEAQRGEEAQWSSQVAETGEAMASKAEKVAKTSSGLPPKGWRKVWAENKEKKKACA